MLLATCCGAPVSAWLKNTPGLSGLLLGVKQLLVHLSAVAVAARLCTHQTASILSSQAAAAAHVRHDSIQQCNADAAIECLVLAVPQHVASCTYN
jgi:hypothetical protein